VSLRSPAAACWTQSFICATVGSVPSAGGAQAATPAPPPVTTWPLVPAVPPPLVRSVTVPGSCWATRKYVMTSRHAAEARNKPTYSTVSRSRTVRRGPRNRNPAGGGGGGGGGGSGTGPGCGAVPPVPPVLPVPLFTLVPLV